MRSCPEPKRRRLGAGREPDRSDTGIVSLKDAHQSPGMVGTDAARLGGLIEAGFDVVPGFVISHKMAGVWVRDSWHRNDNSFAHSALDISTQVDTLWQTLNSKTVTVRSLSADISGNNTNTAAMSEYHIDVDREGLFDAVASICASLETVRNTGQGNNLCIEADNLTEDTGDIVVQTTLDAEYAGVLCTEHPTTSGAMLVEMIDGSSDGLVKGQTTPRSISVGKVSGAVHHDTDASDVPVDMISLLDIGRRLEARFGVPQNIEWTWFKGRFYLLKVRDITHSITTGSSVVASVERERARILGELNGRRRRIRNRSQSLADSNLLSRSELSDRLPNPSPLSADLMHRLWGVGGATDLASQQLDVPYSVHAESPPYFTCVFGRAYINQQEHDRRVVKAPGALARFRMSRDADALASAYTDGFLPVFRTEMIERNAINVDSLSRHEALLLLQAWVDRFVTRTWLEVEKIRILADLFRSTARDKLLNAGINPADVLDNEATGTKAHARQLLQNSDVSGAALEEFLMIFGHRAPLDFELSSPRFSEDEQLLQDYIESLGRSDLPVKTATDPCAADEALAGLIARAQEFHALHEDAAHYGFIELAQIRRLLLSIDQNSGLGGRIFQLKLDEILDLHDQHTRNELLVVTETRMANSLLWSEVYTPETLSLDDLERMEFTSGTYACSPIGTSNLIGTRIAGTGSITGRVRIILNASDISEFEEGEILVTGMIDSHLYPLMHRARGIVAEAGGWLSRGSGIARELGVPTVVGVKGACATITTGDIICVHADGSMTLKVDQRESDSAIEDAKNKAARLSSQRELHQREYGMSFQTDSKRFRYTTMERRSMKNPDGDRRSEVRMGSDGIARPGRRTTDRGRNLSVYRKPA